MELIMLVLSQGERYCWSTWVCSPYELDLLQSVYQVPAYKLCLASFFVDPSIIEPSLQSNNNLCSQHTTYNDSDNTLHQAASSAPLFVFCGGFCHAPKAMSDLVWGLVYENDTASDSLSALNWVETELDPTILRSCIQKRVYNQKKSIF
jgi:hypothetical protein